MTITKDILNDYFAGKASALQKQMIENWLKEAGNEELFYQQLIEYETHQPIYSADVDRAVGQYHQFVYRLETDYESRPAQASGKATLRPTDEPVRGFWRSGWRGWSVAAAVVLLLSAVGWVARDQIYYQTFTTAYGTTQNVTLADGSRVVLNANSTLRVPRFWLPSGERRVHLIGEGLFSVRHTASHQRFVVQTDNGFEVEVLGTVFNVFSRPRGSKVVLNEGRVNVLLTERDVRKRVVLKPGQLVQIDGQKRVRLAQTPAPEDHAAWRDHRYVFDETTVAEIGNVLQENYGLTLTTADKELLRLTVSGSFTASNADDLLQILETTLGITVTRQKNTVILTRRQVQRPL